MRIVICGALVRCANCGCQGINQSTEFSESTKFTKFTKSTKFTNTTVFPKPHFIIHEKKSLRGRKSNMNGH